MNTMNQQPGIINTHWVALSKREDTKESFTAAFDIATFPSISEGDGVILVDSHLEVIAVGRVYRKRLTSNAASIYFDNLVPSRIKSADVAALSHKPSTLQPFIRVDGITFDTISENSIGMKFDDIPCIDGTDPHQQAHIRELLQLGLEADILGPALGPEEEIAGMSVRDRYLVGKLAPRKGGRSDDSIEGLQGQTAEIDESHAANYELQPLAEIGEGKDKGARRRLPGEEFNSTSGFSDPDDDDTGAVDASKNQSFVPSSVGLTFCVDASAKTLEIDVQWGRYEKITSELLLADDGAGKRVWKRSPAGGQLKLDVVSGPVGPLAPDSQWSQVIVQGTIREPLVSGERLVTIFLVNDQPEVERNQDERWIFQPEITVRDVEGRAVFRKRPVLACDGQDVERESLEMIYRHRVEFAVGHGIAIHAETDSSNPDYASQLETRVLPQYEISVTETPGLEPHDRISLQQLVDAGTLDMRTLAAMDGPTLRSALMVLTDDYERWINEQRLRIGPDVIGYDQNANEALDRCEEILLRLRDGVKTLETDDDALRAFQFMNLAMADQRVRSLFALKRRRKETVQIADVDRPKNRSWRPFQLAFVLLAIPALTDPKHTDRTQPLDAIADLLWFPTGGGKTEAYLGVAAFTMAIRRLKSTLGGYDGGRGLSVIMRYTLRLLTLQQFQRATTLVCAMESLRRKDAVWGKEPFTLGLWVGQKITPNTTEASHEAIVAARTPQKRSSKSTPAQLTTCPWCGTDILPGRNIEVRRHANDVGRTILYCGDGLGQCEFSKAKSADIGIPVVLVDEELYRRPPSMLIATVDKFAMMAWCGQTKNLFGRATSECPRHGLLWDEADCNGRHNAQGSLRSTAASSITAIRPPDLIIQDEFHLISGPLGTMVGLYETAIDELCTWQLDEKSVRPKVIASTATVRRAREQVNNVFLRHVAVFPPHGLDVDDNFFSVQRPIEQKPGRRYVGICAPGSARPAVLIRVYTALLTAAQELFEKFGPAADPWMTVVGYFNALRELGGMKRLAEDDVQTRSYRVNMSEVQRPGLLQRNVKNIEELTSRVPSRDIPGKLDRLELTFQGALDPATGRYKVQWAKGQVRAVDVVLATNMLSVGVDVNRLGLMVVNGQPKSVAEYIQATSRVGRSFPGLVCTVMTWSRPRDLSHYESFEHFHSTFYKHVEAQSVTPFAPRALDRGLTGTMVAWLRSAQPQFTPNLGAQLLNDPNNPVIDQLRQMISTRAWRVTDKRDVKDNASEMVAERCDLWIKEATKPGRRLGYQAGRARSPGQDDIAGLLRKPGADSWDQFTAPMSMREVEPDVRLVMSTTTTVGDPQWRPNRNLAATTGGTTR